MANKMINPFLPKLYKKTSTGAIQLWRIWTVSNEIHSESGQVDGKKIKSVDIIKQGKNIGKANETTSVEQARKEAEARWTKKKKKGYVESQNDAAAGKTSSLITGGYVPMTAKVYQDHKKHIVFPCAVQPKLDGIRCTVENGKLFTRTRKPILTLPHIEKEINLTTQMRLDGELYNHDYKDNFEEIVHLVKRDDVHHDHKKVQYHIYDMEEKGTFEARNDLILNKLSRKWIHEAASIIKPVETRIAKDEAELKQIYDDFVEQGYEGAMVRNLNSPYENKRSKHLQKYKEFVDAEFKVVDIEEGRGKLAGSVGAFICEIKDEQGVRRFKTKPKGKLSFLKTLFENEKLWNNRMMTVQFQGYTKKNHVPRFPVGIRFRDDKDF